MIRIKRDIYYKLVCLVLSIFMSMEVMTHADTFTGIERSTLNTWHEMQKINVGYKVKTAFLWQKKTERLPYTVKQSSDNVWSKTIPLEPNDPFGMYIVAVGLSLAIGIIFSWETGVLAALISSVNIRNWHKGKITNSYISVSLDFLYLISVYINYVYPIIHDFFTSLGIAQQVLLNIITFLSSFIGLVLSIPIHELFHYLIGKSVGLDVKYHVIYVSYKEYDYKKLSFIEQTRFSLAGPLGELFFGTMLYLGFILTFNDLMYGRTLFIWMIMKSAILFIIAHAFSNLLPGTVPIFDKSTDGHAVIEELGKKINIKVNSLAANYLTNNLFGNKKIEGKKNNILFFSAA